MVAGGQRRRRVLIEEKLAKHAQDGSAGAPPRERRPRGGSGSGRRNYTDAARTSGQPPSVALLAVRGGTLATAGLLAVCVLAGLQLVHAHLQFGTFAWISREIPALDVGQRAHLAAWFSSLLLVAAAFQATQIYRLRRHKVDDYRGRYRMWVWIPAVLFVMAMCTASGLHRDGIAWLNDWTEGVGAVPAYLVAPLGLCLLWTLICLRMGIEIRGSRGALLLLSLGTVCYFAFAMLEVLRPLAAGPLVQDMLHSSLGYLGHLGVGLAVAVYGRYVYLDAQGQLNHRRTRTRGEGERGESRQTETGAEQRRTGKAAEASDEAEPAKATGRSSAKAAAEAPAAGSAAARGEDQEPAADETSDEQRTLSKSDRRRLRKQKRREQHRRAA